MSDKRKLGPVRQLSLQSDHRMRPILKKQLSVEQLDNIDERKLQPRAESAKNKLSDRPRPIKVAWAENRQTSKEEPVQPSKGKFNEAVEVKKCKEHKRPTTAKLRPQSSMEKESILYTRQELAERLRKAWKEREDNKQNLNIFLTHNVHDKHIDNDLENENYYPEYEDTNNKSILDKNNINTTEEDIISQFKPSSFINNNIGKKVIKTKNTPENTEFIYVPSTTSARPQDIRTNISVTIPSVHSLVKHHQPNQDPSSPPISLETTNKNPTHNNKPDEKESQKKSSLMSPKENENLPPRPLTASSVASIKRESFQKRTNTAFTGSVTTDKVTIRPPLIRTLSVPVKPSEGNKLKFIATKRRLKSARKRTKEQNTSENPDENDDKTNKKGSRCKSAPNGDVVTMVSLVSPAGSDTEEVDAKKVEQKGRNSSPVKSSQSNLDSVKTIALRKTVKSVSFQQSSIHAVRSFSASFPARRGLLTSSASVTEREKRAPMEASPGEYRGPKRRLVKSFSIAGDNDNMDRRLSSQDRSGVNIFKFKKSSTKYKLNPEEFQQNQISSFEETTPPDIDDTIRANILATSKSINSSTEDDSSEDKEQLNETDDEAHNNEEENEILDPNMPKFETNKEKECWLMYKKMSDKGLPVSFDTILRGMLTPTEYRSVRKEMQTTSLN